MGLKVELHGVRGSLVTPRTPQYNEGNIKELIERYLASPFAATKNVAEFIKSEPMHRIRGYGGNTTCVEVQSSQTTLLIDGGSGIRNAVAATMASGCSKGKGTVHIVMTHFHWDHVIGLPFFMPLFIPVNQIHFYAVQEDLEDCIRTLFKRPLFPVSFDSLQAKIFFHKLEPRVPVMIGDMSVTPYRLDHPDPCWGMRIESEGKVYAHCVDTEGVRVSREDLGPDLPLYQNVDLMLFDGQYSLEEAKEKINWGHSAVPIGLEIAIREKIKKVLFIHHDPWASDEKVAQIYNNSLRPYAEHLKSAGPQVDWEVSWGLGSEGQKIVL